MLRPHNVMLAALLGLAACSGGSGSPAAAPGAGMTGSIAMSPAHRIHRHSVGGFNAFGAHAKSLINARFAQLPMHATAMRGAHTTTGCLNGLKFVSPDHNGDANSNEAYFYYNSHCTQLALDAVNVNTSTGTNGETINTTANSYAKGHSGTPTATITAASSVTNATFDAFGFPIASTGFDATTTAQLGMGANEIIANDDELVMNPTSTNVNVFCADFAGYDVAGVASLGATFGWQGGTLDGTATSTANADGSVTWSSTTSGTIVEGPIGSLSIAQGTANTACPIGTPQFTIAGGAGLGNFSIPLTLTFDHALIRNASVTGGTLGNGFTLDVKTNTHKHSGNPNFITGAIRSNGQAVAKFGVDGFGNGHLIVLGTAEYKVVDWTVVQ